MLRFVFEILPYAGAKRGEVFEVAEILRARYSTALCDLVPTVESEMYLYGDRMSSPQAVTEARLRIFASGPGSA